MIQIGEKYYKEDSITETGRSILNDITKVNQKLGEQQLLLNIIQLAKGKLIEELEKEIPNFEEVEDKNVTSTES